MVYYCYIIFSKSKDSFYVGYTSDINERVRLHNSGYFGSRSYTFQASDWKLFLTIPCTSAKQAIFLEARIKRMKSRKYIENLKEFPEMVDRLITCSLDVKKSINKK